MASRNLRWLLSVRENDVDAKPTPMLSKMTKKWLVCGDILKVLCLRHQGERSFELLKGARKEEVKGDGGWSKVGIEKVAAHSECVDELLRYEIEVREARGKGLACLLASVVRDHQEEAARIASAEEAEFHKIQCLSLIGVESLSRGLLVVGYFADLPSSLRVDPRPLVPQTKIHFTYHSAEQSERSQIALDEELSHSVLRSLFRFKRCLIAW